MSGGMSEGFSVVIECTLSNILDDIG
jgi:hypothetical protein